MRLAQPILHQSRVVETSGDLRHLRDHPPGDREHQVGRLDRQRGVRNQGHSVLSARARLGKIPLARSEFRVDPLGCIRVAKIFAGEFARARQHLILVPPAGGSFEMTIHTMSIGELEHMADLVRCNHASLDAMQLIPDGKYQTRTVTLAGVTREVTERLHENFRNRAPEDFPTLVYAWGKCRVGSTALNNLFGAAGLPSYYQPVKTILRHRLLGAAGEPWAAPSAAEHSDRKSV